MKLWLLRPLNYEPAPDHAFPNEWGPWKPWYDKAFGFVVRAESEAEARQMVLARAGDETDHHHNNSDTTWTSAEFSTCEELTAEGPAGVVMRDFAAA